MCGLLAAPVAGCLPLHATYYEPSGAGELRNATLCSFGIGNQLVVQLGHGVSAAISAGDPDAAQLTLRIELRVPEGASVRLTDPTFSVASEAREWSQRVDAGTIAASCGEPAPGCKALLAASELLEGANWKGSGLLHGLEPRLFSFGLVVPVAPVAEFSVRFPPLQVDEDPVVAPVVRFRRTSKLTVEGLCQ